MRELKDLPWWKAIDIPPVWLVLFIALAWIQSRRLPVFPLDHPILDLIGGVLVGGGVLLMVFAVLQLRQAKTTVIPHLDPNALVTDGLFARSRNPIYLGDAMVLAGLCLFWGSWLALLLVPLFIWLITDRFILGEEERLRTAFGPSFEAWTRTTRRWI
ncbi:MAG: isoprenylcysteine carboxylmethyltransferase family protein [Pseudomonadota bacterium]